MVGLTRSELTVSDVEPFVTWIRFVLPVDCGCFSEASPFIVFISFSIFYSVRRVKKDIEVLCYLEF